MRVAVLNGPNLNLLGLREPEIYGRASLADIEALVRAEARPLGIEIDWFQSNHEGALIDAVQALPGRAAGCLLNAGAFSHTSLALRDAIASVPVPVVEVHLSNILAREPARRHSVLADATIGMIAGFGPTSYLLGLRALHARLGNA